MELALAIFNVGAGIGILAVGASVAYLAWRLTPLIAETRALTHDLRRLTRTTEAELRPLLDRAREVTRSAEVLTDDAAVRVARLAEMVEVMEEAARRPITATAHPAAVGSVESTETSEEGWDR
ncbi:MAG: hypothetical protein ABI841_02695 [Chloroflexota bacterium]